MVLFVFCCCILFGIIVTLGNKITGNEITLELESFKKTQKISDNSNKLIHPHTIHRDKIVTQNGYLELVDR